MKKLLGINLSHSRFRRFGVVTIASVYLLILVGGIVRSTGSGMGCPDWPKCFGMWVPPTDVTQLPENYKEVFKVAGKEIADFNVFHTWTEYINRLIGALIGLFILVTALFSLSFWRSDRLITVLSIFTFLAVGFQGWLGSVVVATDLKPFLITLHMLMALFIVSILIYTIVRSFTHVLPVPDQPAPSLLTKLLLGCMALTLLQVVLGTQVREGIDVVARAFEGQQRELWLDEVGAMFYVHRSFSILVLILHVAFAYLLYQNFRSSSLYMRWGVGLMAVLLLEIASGIVMAYFAIPKSMQPVHLLLGTLSFGVQFVLLMLLNYKKTLATQPKAKQTVMN